MADKAFGVDQLDILGTGTPTISAPNQLNLDCHTVAISTSVTVGANLTVNGNIDLGNASSDTISLTGVVDTNIIPSADSSKDIGSNSVRFANGYFDTVYGSGANLTSLPAANLTGTLPAISGANLTNLPTIAGIWSVGHNGASNYVISGPGGLSNANNPDLYLERGKTYQFVVNASGHPFGIQTVSGTWTGSNAYTTGITNAAAAVGTITFAVPYSAPARLYYACTSQHSGMVGNLYIQGAASTVDVSNNADNRIITGGSGSSLNGETNLLFDGGTLALNGRYQRGSATVQDGDSIAGGININGTDMDASVIMSVFGNDNDFTRISGSKSRNASIGGHTIVQNNDVLLSLKGFGSDGSNFEEAAQIEMQVDGTPNNNVMPGRIVFKTTTTDGVAERLRITSAGDVGIANNSPSCRLAVTDTAEHAAYANVTPSVTACMMQLYNNPPNETANDHATMQFGVNGGTHNRVASISAVVESAANRKLAFAFCTDEAGSRTEKMRIHGDGHVTKPLNPAFRARASSGGWKSFGNTSFNIMPFNATDCNNGNHYNTSTYKFTVPVSGNYYFYCQMQHDGTTTNGGTSGQMQIVVQGVAVIAYGKSGRQGEVVNCGTVWPCSAGNVIYCEGRTNITNPDDWHGDSYYSFFTGYLVG